MRIDVITLFPELVATMQDHGVVGRALRSNLVELELTNPRDFSDDVNNRVDDRPYGGGPGMVMQYAPLIKTLEHVKSMSGDAAKVVYLSPQGRRLDQAAVRNLSQCPNLILLCGRYEGIDERFIEAHVDEEWSIGDYVISGGELAAMVLIDAMVRTLPGVLGDDQSAEQESFESGLLDCPHYSRPEIIDGLEVPKELISGDHKKIASWRLKQALGRTYLRRPDMIELKDLSDQEQQLLNEYLVEVKAKNER
jgi:tRNA (guanine37-N1)-methyltransferase